MRRLRGFTEAKAFFDRHAWSIHAPLPAPVRERTREIFGEDLSALEVASRIIADVRLEGDAAIIRHSSAIDGEPLAFIEVPPEKMQASLDEVPTSTRAALEIAAERVRAFQDAARPSGWRDPAGQYGEIVTPVPCAGAYVPGGSAPLVSTVLMTVVPARAAGVKEVILATPAAGDSLPDRAMLAAAAVAGVDRIFKIGGAQAIAAMALGSETVPRVDLVCGPGNVFVVAAKMLLFGEVGIDGLYGPTEAMVIADESADSEFCAADLVAQAEHDIMARPVLVATSDHIADRVEDAITAQIEQLDRRAIAAAAIQDNGAAVIVSTVEEGIRVANHMAPEHLSLVVDDPTKYVPLVRAAGGIFLGKYSAEVLGDYAAGPSHVMPTGGTARFASALSVRSFLRFTPLIEMDEHGFLAIARHAAELARVEGLTGHAAAAEIRIRRLVGE